ncbi:hypothetical protein [Marininema halotolerans]|uniref:Uncharacterized protein n=1 Tax=Marininema halotolerans TaxID=1155944 RepID=A0A1I6NS64_9BACL|nr:hypothetical protein [Marininema halotolerans]SFS30744.1 hypothetical protein SAMN05444972_10175 [Marininema halotolerans]
MLQRWMGRYLAVYLSVPCIIALIYIALYQGWRDSSQFYLFWLGESYFFPILPVVALVVWRVHWGKKHPLLYLFFSLLLLTVACWIGTDDARKDYGRVEERTIHPIGVVEDHILTQNTRYQIPYFPYEEERLLTSIRHNEAVDVWVVQEKQLILAFKNPKYSGYGFKERLLDLGAAIFALIVFASFLWVTMRIWWREVEISTTEVMIRNWRQQPIHVPFQTIIYIHFNKEEEEIHLETEEMVYNFPYREDKKKDMLAAAKLAGLTSLQDGLRWVRDVQCEELQLNAENLICMGAKGWVVPYRQVVALTWNTLIQVVLEDDSVHTITDRRYLDQAWFKELACKVTQGWEQMRIPYEIQVEPDTGRIVYSLTEE